MFDGTARGKKELKRAKQARQQRASGSDCNLAVNRMLTTTNDLLAWIDTLWLRREAMRSNATNCSDGVPVFSNRDQMKPYDPIWWDDTTRGFALGPTGGTSAPQFAGLSRFKKIFGSAPANLLHCKILGTTLYEPLLKQQVTYSILMK